MEHWLFKDLGSPKVSLNPSPEVEIVRAERLKTEQGWVNVLVELLKAEDPLTVCFSHQEVKAFDDWVKAFRGLGRTVTVRDAVWAFLVAHGSGSKSLIAGFLRASGWDVDPRAVGVILSRLKDQNLITKDTVMTRTVFDGVPHKIKYKTILGESIYYLGVEERKWAMPPEERERLRPLKGELRSSSREHSEHWLFHDLSSGSKPS